MKKICSKVLALAVVLCIAVGIMSTALASQGATYSSTFVANLDISTSSYMSTSENRAYYCGLAILEYLLHDTDNRSVSDMSFTRNYYVGLYNGSGSSIDLFIPKASTNGYYNLFYAPGKAEITEFTAYGSKPESELTSDFPAYYKVSGSDVYSALKQILEILSSDN